MRPLCLPDPENELEDEWVTVVGWGRKEYFGNSIHMLLSNIFIIDCLVD